MFFFWVRLETGLSGSSSAQGGKLESLFDEEGRGFSGSVPIVLLRQRRRERVEEERDSGGGGFAEEKWRFQAEILRAECNFLRMERELALKKLERNRVQMERTLRSAVHTLVSVRLCFFSHPSIKFPLIVFSSVKYGKMSTIFFGK